ncbi:MAG: hypothetical protein ACK4GN_01335 [Runella sp.]
MLLSSHIRQRLALCLFALFALMLLNGVVFRHAHKLSSGKVITHAHPYKPVGNLPYQPNNHTDNELFLLDLMANGSFVAAPSVSMPALALAVFVILKSSFLAYRQRFLSRTKHALSLRGPPTSGTPFMQA